MTGRPPKSIEAKILTGTFREDRDGPLASAVKAEGAPDKPPYLAGAASDLWDALAPQLAGHGTGKVDAATMTAMCECWGRYRKAADQLDKLKSMATKTARVLAIQAAEALKCFNLFACRFGLTPADRTRLKVQPQKKAGVPSRRRA